MRMPVLVVVASCFASACSCAGKGSADAGTPTVDVPPASFGPSGIVVEQPADGDALTGAWVSVTGWLDPKRWRAAFVIGAPVRGYYALSSGHGAVPTVPVRVRPDGRFVAPRVPLQDGPVSI